MSDTQTSITDRFPKKASRTSSILSKDVPPDKKPKSDKPTSPSSQEFDPTDSPVQTQRRGSRELAEGKTEACGLVQRCVIIQKDENGFGLTVSGDNPVFVQLVKDDGAAMRAGVQTGDRIIKVNGTLVTHSNHVEVVKLIKSGSYVALTVLGRPPGLPQIPLPEVDGDLGLGRPGDRTSFSSPHSPGQQLSLDRPGTDRPGTERPFSPTDLITSPLPAWAMKEEYSRKPSPRLLKDIQGANKHIPQLQGQLCKATGVAQDGDGEEGGGVADPDRTASSRGDNSTDGSWSSNNMSPVPRGFGPVSPESLYHRDSSFPSPRSTPRDSLASCQSPDAEDSTDQDCLSPSAAGTPSSSSSRLASQIIGAEDDYFDSDQEQPNGGQAGGFQSVELLKSRPAHLGAFLHHVISQFDPAPLLCYLHADLYKQTNSKESRRVFLDFHSFFIDRGANLKVAVPESMASDLDRRRTELIPEETTRQYVQTLQDSLLPDIQRHLEDFRQKRCMGLTLAEVELVRLDSDRGRDRLALDRERSCAESIITKIEELLLATQPTEEERCTTMQYVILTYMKHLGVRVKEPRGLEPKRVRINFLPKIKKSMKAEKEGGEEKVKRTRFPSILGPQRRPSRIESAAAGKAVDGARPRPQKQLSQPILGASDQPEAGRLRGSQSSEGSELTYPASLTAHSPCSSVYGSEGSRDTEAGGTPTSALSRLSDGLQSAELDSLPYPANMHFDYSPSPYSLDQLQEEDRESDRVLEGGTPKALRRLEGVVLGEVQSEDDQGTDSEHDPLNWQQLVGREVLAGLRAHEIKRQEVINELFYTERAHVRMLRVLDSVFYQRLTRDSILPPADVKNIFTNLDEIVQLHVSISDQMAALRKRNESSVIIEIGDDLLSWFSDGEEEKIKQAVGTFCSNQPFSLEIIKSRQKKDSRFNSFLQEAESNRLCRRLQLKDIIPVEMQRLTKYPLLLENIAKCTDSVEEKDKVKRAADCCRRILHHVNQAVRESENKQRLEDYQRRLDLSSLKQTENPMIMELKNLDLTKKKMVHEGPLSWKVNRDKTIELYTLLLEDILVLLQRQDERLILKCHSKNLPGASDTKHTFSPVIRLNAVLVRSVATDNKSFFVLSMSDSGAQIYELMAPTVADQRTWQCLITQRADAIKEVKPHSVIPSLPSLPQTDERDGVEIITAGVSRLSKELPDRTSTGSSRSTDKESTSASSTMTSSSTSTIVQGSLPGAETEEEEEEEEGFVDPELPDRLAYQVPELPDRLSYQVPELPDRLSYQLPELPDRLAYQVPELPDRLSYQVPAVDGAEADSVGYSASRADEALKTLSALKRVLVTQLMSQEASERAQRSSGARLLRTTSLRTPVDSRARLPVHNGTEKDQGQKDQNQKDQSQSQPDDPGQDPGSGDTGFFDTPEDYAGYLVLEEFGGSGESTTDDDLPGKQLGAARGCAGDSGISLRFSSASQGGSLSSFSRQVLSHLRNLQTSLNQLKEVEAKYYTLVRSRPERDQTDTDQNRDKR